MKRPSAASFRLWLRLLAYARPWRWRLLAAVVAALIAAAAAAGWAALLGPLLDAVLKSGPVTIGPWVLESTDVVQRLPWVVIALSAVKALAAWLHSGLMNGVAQGTLAAIRRALYGQLVALPPRWFESRHSGELLSRFTSDVGQVEFSVTQALSSWAKDSLQVLGLMAVCWAADPRLFVLTFVVVPGMVIPVTRFAKSVRRTAQVSQASVGALTQLVAESLSNLPVVHAFQAEAVLQRRFEGEQAKALAVMKRSLFLRGAFTPVTEFVGILGVALTVVVGTRAIAAEPALGSKVLSFLASALLMYQPMKALAGTFSQVMQGLGAAGRLFDVLDAHVEPDAGAVSGPLTSLRFDRLAVTYPDGRQALRGLTFEVPVGQVVALVGASGAGKSTAVSALLGLVPATSGAVVWNGRPLSEWSLASVRAQLAWVPQEPVLVSGTVRDNLRIGRAEANDEAMWQALERAHAAAFVRAWPLGLDEEVGERGARLSGGQRQRLAIARAFVKEPSLLVLDEPTSALDAASEGEVQAGLAELMKGRTVLVVAHRLATIRAAELIVVLHEGQVVEVGTHQALLARQGRYTELLAASSA